MSSGTGISVSADCVTVFNELKLGKKLRYIIYKLSDNMKEIVPDESGTEEDWEVFRKKLLEKKDPKYSTKTRPSYAVYDVHYELEEGQRTKIMFISYIDDDHTHVRSKMVYASSRETLKNALVGLAMDWQASDSSELEFAEVKKAASKGKAL